MSVETSTNHKTKDNSWHNLVAVVDRGRNKLTLYDNGNQYKVEDIASLGAVDNPGLLIIGQQNPEQPVNFFGGIIDECAIYKEALSEKEIKQNFAASKRTFPVLSTTQKLALIWGEIKVSR